MTPDKNNNIMEDIIKLLIQDGFGGIGEAVRKMINLAMYVDREKYLGVGPYERSEKRNDQANGFKSKTCNGSFFYGNQIFNMFPNRMTISKIMVRFYQAVEQFFPGSIANLLDFKRLYLSKIPAYFSLINFNFCRFGSVYKRIFWSMPLWRKGNMSCTVETYHKSPGHHVPQCAIGLNPVPCLA